MRLHQVPGPELARTVRIGAGPGPVRSPTVDASPGVNCRLEPPRSAIASQLGSPPYCPIVFSPCRHLRAFPSLHWDSAEGKRARDPARLIERKPPGRWDNADRSPAPAPQSKPVTPASRLMAQETPLVASGLGLRILAAGPATYRQYSYRQRCGRQSQIHRDWHEIRDSTRSDARSTKLAGYTPPSWLPHRAISDILGTTGTARWESGPFASGFHGWRAPGSFESLAASDICEVRLRRPWPRHPC